MAQERFPSGATDEETAVAKPVDAPDAVHAEKSADAAIEAPELTMETAAAEIADWWANEGQTAESFQSWSRGPELGDPQIVHSVSEYTNKYTNTREVALTSSLVPLEVRDRMLRIPTVPMIAENPDGYRRAYHQLLAASEQAIASRTPIPKESDPRILPQEHLDGIERATDAFVQEWTSLGLDVDTLIASLYSKKYGGRSVLFTETFAGTERAREDARERLLEKLSEEQVASAGNLDPLYAIVEARALQALEHRERERMQQGSPIGDAEDAPKWRSLKNGNVLRVTVSA